MDLQFIHEHGFVYADSGGCPQQVPIVLLHGLLGNPEGWTQTYAALRDRDFRVIVPDIPIDRLGRDQANVRGIVRYVRSFTDALNLESVVLVGNSLGGQIALYYTLDYPATVCGLILTGSSGIYEMEMGTATFRRKDRAFIREKAEKTFFDPAMVTDDLVERIYKLANDRARALRVVWIARSSMKNSVGDRLREITVPTALIWGKQDNITPPDVAEIFMNALPSAELYYIQDCGHAPMMEHPETFNHHALGFLVRELGPVALPQVPA